jgi:hypothetical protein
MTTMSEGRCDSAAFAGTANGVNEQIQYRDDGPVCVGDVFDAGWGGRTWRVIGFLRDDRARVSVELDGQQETLATVSLKVGLKVAPRVR